MTTNEFIFGSRADADRFARGKRWRPVGRASWIKPNGTCVHFLTFEEQLAAISKGERVYVLRDLSGRDVRTLKKVGAVVVKV